MSCAVPIRASRLALQSLLSRGKRAREGKESLTPEKSTGVLATSTNMDMTPTDAMLPDVQTQGSAGALQPPAPNALLSSVSPSSEALLNPSHPAVTGGVFGRAKVPTAPGGQLRPTIPDMRSASAELGKRSRNDDAPTTSASAAVDASKMQRQVDMEAHQLAVWLEPSMTATPPAPAAPLPEPALQRNGGPHQYWRPGLTIVNESKVLHCVSCDIVVYTWPKRKWPPLNSPTPDLRRRHESKPPNYLHVQASSKSQTPRTIVPHLGREQHSRPNPSRDAQFKAPFQTGRGYQRGTVNHRSSAQPITTSPASSSKSNQSALTTPQSPSFQTNISSRTQPLKSRSTPRPRRP